MLIVDDEEETRIAAQLGIALTTDWEARSAANGDEALACCRDWRPQAVLLDTAMPDCEVFTTLEAMRASAGLEGVPVVLVADPSTPADALEDRRGDVEGVLHKPLDMLSFGSELAALLGWPKTN